MISEDRRLSGHHEGRRSTRVGGFSLSRAGWVWILAVVALVAVAAVVVVVVRPGMATPHAVAAERIDTDRNSVPIAVVGAFGTAAVAGTTSLASSADGDAAVAAVLSDLQDFWAVELGADGGPGLKVPAGGYVSMDSSSTAGGSALCISDPQQITGNAFYCPGADGIVFDSAALVPVLLGSYGSAGLTAAFAHEFGHAVQAQIGPTMQDRQLDPDRYPAILIEAQADCDAGAFLAWAAGASGSVDPEGQGSDAGDSAPTASAAPDAAATVLRDPRVHIPRESLVRAVAPLLDFRDPATVSPEDPTAHGLGLDRLGFLLVGLRDGADACPAMTVDDLQLTLGSEGVTTSPPSTLPRFPSTADVLQAANSSVTAFVAGLPGAPAIPTEIVPDAADLSRAESLGQFASAASVALAAGRLLSADDSRTRSVAACFTGAWTASVFGRAGVDELGTWPTDADEALDLIRSKPGASIDELAGYSDGFHQGWAACS